MPVKHDLEQHRCTTISEQWYYIFAHFWVTLGKIIKCHGEIMTFRHSTHLVFIIMFY